MPRVYYGRAFEDVDFPLFARMTHEDDSTILKAHISTWDLYVYDLSSQTPSTELVASTGNLATATNNDGSSVMFDTLQLGAGWREDEIGFNWRRIIAAALYPRTAGHVYRHSFIYHRPSRGDHVECFEVEMLSRKRT